MSEAHGFICGPKLYEFEGWFFEFYDGYGLPWPLRKKDGEPFRRAGRVFYKAFGKWYDLPEAEREKYRVGGGCRSF